MSVAVCYICLEEECENNPFKNPVPCLCKGTTMIHRKCFIEVRKKVNKCPNCKATYNCGALTLECPPGMKLISASVGNSGFINEYIVDKNGVKNGRNQLIFQDLYISHECTYRDGKMHGTYTRYYPSGYINYTSEYVNGMKHGVERIYYMEDEQVHKEIEFKRDIKNGFYREYSREGRLILEYHMLGNEKHGQYRKWHENSGVLTLDLYYDHDKYHGPYKRYYSNGIPEVDTVYVNHKYHGYYRMYYTNGALECECEYKNGLLNGSYKSYKMNGEVQTTVLYGRTLVA